jgi:NAD+ kinase
LVGKFPNAGVAAQGESRALLADVAGFLRDCGCEVFLEESTARHLDHPDYKALSVDALGAACDVCVVLGGDGTMLGMGRRMAEFGVPLIGINQGRLGFITDIALDHFKATLAPMLAGDYAEEQRSLIQARVVRDKVCVFSALAMNDVVVNRGATSGMVELRVEVNGHFVAKQRADGLIIATPTGSTAYALSAGGPMIHPATRAWVLVPIAPHTLSNRPLVLDDSAEIVIELVAGRDASANFDMQSLAALLHGDRIEVSRSRHAVRFLHPRGWTFFDTLRNKLHWNEGVV